MSNRIIAVILIVVGLFLGYQGIEKLDNSSASVEIGGLELSANNESAKSTAFVYLGGAAFLLLGGVYVMKRK